MLATDRGALVAKLIKKTRAAGGWAGQTHIQKTMFFLQDLLQVPGGYNFVLYRHGPYSFDLRSELGRLRVNAVLDVDLQRPYGASFKLGEAGSSLIQRGIQAVNKYYEQLDFVVDTLARKDVMQLERLGTALLVKNQHADSDEFVLANKIVAIKPHISSSDALEAVRAVAQIEDEAKAKGLIPK